MSDRLTEALADRLGLTPYQQGTVAAAVLALIQGEEARQAIAAGIHHAECEIPDYGGCAAHEHLEDASHVQAALVAFLKENPDG